jgi:hypothetical protein
MGLDNLLAIRRETSANSNHKQQAGPSRTHAAIRKAIEQSWIVDITCIQGENEPHYLVVVCDAVSHEIVGWALDRTVEEAAGKAGLRSALLQQPCSMPGASFQSPDGVLGPMHRLALTAQD